MYWFVFLEDRKTDDRLNVLRDVWNEHKEMIARPMITLIPSIFSLFSLPLFIISFSLACQTETINRLRYLLLISYFLLFIPQIMTFFLYIYPSTFHLKEWKSTTIAKRIGILRQQFSSLNITNLSMSNEQKSRN